MGRGSRTLTQALLATTCLTVASLGPAHASLLAESTDFTSTLPGAPLPLGTDQVTGARPSTDLSDVFTFIGLVPGQPFTITYDETDPFGDLKIALFSVSPQAFLGLQRGDDGTLQGTVPADGKIAVEVGNFEFGNGTYSVTLDAPLAPIPTPAPSALTLSAVGAALAGALGWRRRRTHGRAAG